MSRDFAVSKYYGVCFYKEGKNRPKVSLHIPGSKTPGWEDCFSADNIVWEEPPTELLPELPLEAATQ